MVFLQGNHDPADTVGLSPSGNNDPDSGAYGVYLIHEDDYSWSSETNEEEVKNAASALKTYLDGKLATNWNKPIFIVSHIQLHYSMRTYEQRDGMYANLLFDVINEAAGKGLNIIFLFGHNHSNGWDDYLGGAAVYLKKGDVINIAQSSTKEFEKETLNFTYMNAGYVGYYGGVNTGADTALTMTIFRIVGNEVTISRYDQNGLHNLKSKGVVNAYKREDVIRAYSPNRMVYPSSRIVTATGDVDASEVLTHQWNEATCTAPKTCATCGETEGKALGHKYTTTTTKATLSKNGSVIKKCTVCSHVASNTTVSKVTSIAFKKATTTYDGTTKKPSVVVKDATGKILSLGKDYTVTYPSGMKKAGTYKVKVTMIGNYSGTKTLTYTINPISVSTCKISFKKATTTYDGKVKTPTVVVKNANGTLLTKGVHYKVVYPANMKKVGTYKVKVVMLGNYSGTKTLTYTIKK